MQSDGNKDLDLFLNLPLEITIQILSSLPVGSIINSKLVCKAWRDLIGSREFALVHLSKPKPDPNLISRMVYYGSSYEFWELDNGSNLPNKLFQLDVSYLESVHGSVSGLVMFYRLDWVTRFQFDLLICNPITREYVRLPDPPYPDYPEPCYLRKYLGFGVSRRSKQYKVVMIFQSECQVYTLGTGQWRSMAVGGSSPLHAYADRITNCAFAGGNLHWLDHETLTKVPCSVSCFDLETEVLTSFSTPPPPPPQPPHNDTSTYRSLSVLEDCLCLCDVSSQSTRCVKIDVWLRKGEDWGKRFVISDDHLAFLPRYVFPIKVLEDGGMLLRVKGTTKILHYSNKKKKKKATKSGFQYINYLIADVYTPSFLSLKPLLMGKEDVQSF